MDNKYTVNYNTGLGDEIMRAKSDADALRKADKGATYAQEDYTVTTPTGETYTRRWTGCLDGVDYCIHPVKIGDGYYADWLDVLPGGRVYGLVVVDGDMVTYIG